MTPPTTPKDVASWMTQELHPKKCLYQVDIVYVIAKRFGKQFVYENQNGNLAISKEVLRAFCAMTPDAVWERGERCWRPRQPHEPHGQRQVD